MSKRAKSVTLKFVEVINAGDSEGLIRLQTEDFTLIDMCGTCFMVGMDGKAIFHPIPTIKLMCNMF